MTHGTMTPIHEGLDDLARRPHTPGSFKRAHSDELLEGLLSKGYVVVEGVLLSLTLEGVRALLDFEGMPYV